MAVGRTVGRNEPCPCGSGRKHKRCCLAAGVEIDGQRYRLRHAEGIVVNAVLDHIRRRYGRDLIDPAGELRAVRFPWLKRGKDRKSTRLNSSHRTISYAVFCLKKKKIK